MGLKKLGSTEKIGPKQPFFSLCTVSLFMMSIITNNQDIFTFLLQFGQKTKRLQVNRERERSGGTWKN